MSVRCRRGDAATYGREKPFPLIALSAAVAAAGLSLAAFVGKGRRRAHQARLCKATHLLSPASGECGSHVHDQSAPLEIASAGASSWAIQVYQPWRLSVLVLAIELPTEGCSLTDRSPKAHSKDAFGIDDDRYLATSSDSDVYDSDTGVATACLAPSPAIGDPMEVSDDTIIYFEPYDMVLELGAAVEGAVQPNDLSLAASLAIHEPYPSAETLKDPEPIIPNTPDSFSILPPPPRSSRLPRSCSSLSHLRSAESWTSTETGIAELAQRIESRGYLSENLDDDLRVDEALGRIRVAEPAERSSHDGVRKGLDSLEWALAAASVSGVSSVNCGDGGGDGSSSSTGGVSCPSSSQRGFTSDCSSLDLPEPDLPDGADVTVTVTMGNPLFMKTTDSINSSSSSADLGVDGAAGTAGRACRRLAFEALTTLDNPCFVAVATRVNNPCFGSDALEGAIPALLQPYPAAAAAAAASRDPLGAVASAGVAQWHPRNPLAEESSPFRIEPKQQQPPQQQQPQQEQPQQQAVVVEAKAAIAVKVVVAEADVPVPPVTPAKPPPPLATAAPVSPISTPRPPPVALAYWRALESSPDAAAPLPDTNVPTPPVPVATAADADAAAVAAACASLVADAHAAAPLPCCSPTQLSDQLSQAALETPPPLQQPPHSAADSHLVVEAPPIGRSASGPAPRLGPGPANRPPWRPTACPYKAPGAIAADALTAAVAGCSSSLRSSLALSVATTAASRAVRARKTRSPGGLAQSRAAPPQRPPFRPPSKCSAGFQAQAGDAATRGSAARKPAEWAPGTPSFLRPTHASLAAAANTGGAGSVAGSRMGGTAMETGGRKGEVQRPSDKRPLWR